MNEKGCLLFGRIPETLSLEDVDETNKAFQELKAKFDAMPEVMKKDICQFLFEETERIMKSVEENLKYSEPLRIIGFMDYKI